MPQRVVVRQSLRARTGSARTLDERLLLRFPRLASASAHLVGRLPPTSKLRRVALARTVTLATEAYNRRDLDAVTIAWSADCEYRPGPEWVQAGLTEPCYRGADGYRRYVAATEDVWGTENQLEPLELIDLGDQIVLLADGRMRARASGVPLREAFAVVSTLRDGKAVRHQEYYVHADALRAVGLSV